MFLITYHRNVLSNPKLSNIRLQLYFYSVNMFFLSQNGTSRITNDMCASMV